MRPHVIAACLLSMSIATSHADPVVKTAAPIAMKESWLGLVMADDFSGPTKTRAITANPISQIVNEYRAEVVELESSAAIAAAFSGYGVKAKASAGASQRYALYTVYKISTLVELDTAHAKFDSAARGYVPTRIFYGWAMYVLIEGDEAHLNSQVEAKVLGVEASLEAEARRWGLKTTVQLRGLTSKDPRQVVVARTPEDVINKFEVDTTKKAQPILVEYKPFGGTPPPCCVIRQFEPPPFQPLDGEFAQYRLYPDPSIASGKLQVHVTDAHSGDWAVFEIFKRGDRDRTFRWESWYQRPASGTVDLPTWPMDLVWAGHKTLPLNSVPDASFGWTLDFVRVK